jgi:hypothetical protein
MPSRLIWTIECPDSDRQHTDDAHPHEKVDE